MTPLLWFLLGAMAGMQLSALMRRITFDMESEA